MSKATMPDMDAADAAKVIKSFVYHDHAVRVGTLGVVLSVEGAGPSAAVTLRLEDSREVTTSRSNLKWVG